MSTATPQDIGHAAATLAASPADYDTWLHLAGLLAAAGRRQESETAFLELGRAGCAVGQVALAVACARWLDLRDLAVAGVLIDQIVKVHAAGSKQIDPAARPKPPPAAAAPPTVRPPASMDTAVAAATKAIAQAGKAAAARAPATYPPTPLVSSLPADDVKTLIGVMQPSALPRGHVVVEVGAPATHLYWIARGAVQVSRDEHILGELLPGSFFGEIALVGGGNRTGTVTCTLDTWLLAIPAAEIEAMAAKHPRLAKALARHARARLLANVMKTSELFAQLSEEDKAELLGRFETVMVPAGNRFITRAANNDHLWVVVSGQCEVRHGDTLIETLGPGDGIGEISLLAQKPATADVIAIKPTALLRLARAEFDQVAVKYPQLLAEVYKLLVAREQELKRLVHDASDLVV